MPAGSYFSEGYRPDVYCFKNFSRGDQHRAVIAIFLLSAILGLSGCSAVVGAGAGVGLAAVQERGIKVKANDIRLEALVLKNF